MDELTVTKAPTEVQTQTLQRHSDPSLFWRIRDVDDDGSNAEAPDNAMTDKEGESYRE